MGLLTVMASSLEIDSVTVLLFYLAFISTIKLQLVNSFLGIANSKPVLLYY